MLSLPLMSMQSEALTFRLWNPRIHTHLQDDHSWEDFRLAHDWTLAFVSKLGVTKYKDVPVKVYLLPTIPTEAPLNTFPTSCRIVFVYFHFAFGIIYCDFVFLDGEVG